ncbi:MAG: hypothetical protein K8R91_03170 [Phycisphaerae bacterium]|nr:hypothetical protein [Phycisphaerae bacterium]
MVEKSDRLLVLCLLSVLVILPVVAGCGGVIMNAEYSALLDKTTALSTETALRAGDGALTTEQMKVALLKQAETWQKFKDARDGKDGSR